MYADPDAGRLERSLVQRNVEDISVGSVVLHLPDDVRQLRSVQFARSHSGRRIRSGSTVHCVFYNFDTGAADATTTDIYRSRDTGIT